MLFFSLTLAIFFWTKLFYQIRSDDPDTVVSLGKFDPYLANLNPDSHPSLDPNKETACSPLSVSGNGGWGVGREDPL